MGNFSLAMPSPNLDPAHRSRKSASAPTISPERSPRIPWGQTSRNARSAATAVRWAAIAVPATACSRRPPRFLRSLLNLFSAQHGKRRSTRRFPQGPSLFMRPQVHRMRPSTQATVRPTTIPIQTRGSRDRTNSTKPSPLGILTRISSSRARPAVRTTRAGLSTEREPCLIGAGSITHILETRRRQRGLKPPLRLTLPDRPGLRDLDVQPHDLETYDALGRNTPDDAAD